MARFAFVFVSFAFLALAGASEVQHVEARAACRAFVTIETRGTGEMQGPSAAFVPVMDDVSSTLRGDFNTYNTKYAAATDQNSKAGTQDIINRIKKGLKECPDQKYLLLGVSQGAAATTAVLQKTPINSKVGRAIAGVLLYGNPLHRPHKQSNVDQNGKKTTNDVTGLSRWGEGIPKTWDKSGRVMDVCFSDDIVCSSVGSAFAHFMYPFTQSTNNLATKFLVGKAKPQVKAFRAKMAKLDAAKLDHAKVGSISTRHKRARSFGDHKP